MIGSLCTLTLVGMLAHAETIGAGETVANAALVDLTEEGLSDLAQVAGTLIPVRSEIEEQSDSGEVDVWVGDLDYSYSLTNAWVGAEVISTSVTPLDSGELEVTLSANMWLNTIADPFLFEYDVDILGDDSCFGHVESFPANLYTTVGLEIVENAEGNPAVDATVSEVEVEQYLDKDLILMEDCSIDTIEEVLDAIGYSLYDVLVEAAEEAMYDELEDLDDELEEEIEEALDNLVLEEEFEVEDANMMLRLAASDLVIDSGGVRLTAEGSVNVQERAECVAALDPGGSESVDSEPPLITDMTGHDGVLFLSDEFANQALYTLWVGGALCYAVNEEQVGLPIDTSLLSMVVDGVFDELFPEVAPMELQLRPESAPEVTFGVNHDVGVGMDDLAIGFYAELDDRTARVLGMNIETELGMDVSLDDTTGEITVGMDVDLDEMVHTAAFNEFVSESSAEIEEGFVSFFDVMVADLLFDNLYDRVITLESIEMYGLDSLDVAAVGDLGDWGAAYAGIGEVTYGTGGCSGTDESGCSSGCSGGCGLAGSAGARGGGTGLWFGLPIALLIVRRRQHEFL